jgi:tetratricopeptide (TPR) repeat protein
MTKILVGVRVSARWVALVAVLFVAGSAAAQVPDKFTNLQVLPKDTPKPELVSMMRGFAFALDVRCNYCHAQKSDGKGMDFASDEKETKKTARVMLKMVAAINQDYIAKLPPPTALPAEGTATTPPAAAAAPSTATLVKVQCVTCHHGLALPRTLNSILVETIEAKGIDAATAQYAELRKEFAGGAQYDFGETSLNQLTESLIAQKKTKEAVAIMEMSFAANHPDTVWSYHMLAMAHQANGQDAEALADFRKVFELHPDDDWAKQQIEALSKTAK